MTFRETSLNSSCVVQSAFDTQSLTQVIFNFVVGDPSVGCQLHGIGSREDKPLACFDLIKASSNSTVSQWQGHVIITYGTGALEKVLKRHANTDDTPLAKTDTIQQSLPTFLRLPKNSKNAL